MLIQAKAHDKKSTKPDAKGPFQFTKTEKRNKLPAWVAMALTLVFAYFKQVSVGPAVEEATAADRFDHNAKAAPHDQDIGAGAAQLNGHAPTGARPPQSHIGEDHYAVSDEPALTVFNPSRQFVSGSALAPQVRSAHAHNDNSLFAEPYGYIPAQQQAAWSPAVVTSTPTPRLTNTAPTAPAADPTPVQTETEPAPEESAAPPVKTNRAPVVSGPVRLNNVIAGQTMLLALGDLLLGAHDADGDQLQISNITPSNGTLVQIGDGWSFHANAGAQTLTTLSYDISDGHAVVHQTADFHILSAVQTLTAGDDVHVGSANADQIDALDGDDIIDAGAGDDIVSGGNGGDHIMGGDGNDVLFGGAGDDIIFGGRGNDVISGGDGNDRLFGEDGNDILSGDAGDDYLSGGAGDDILTGGAGNDVVDGGAGNDDLDGGEGIDTIDYSTSSAAVAVDLIAHTASGSEIGEDVISNFERILGSCADDLFRVGEDEISIQGGGGDDHYEVNIGGTHLQITDFAVGDRIHVGDYDVMERNATSDAPDFSDVYCSVPSDNALPIMAQNGTFDGFEITVLEARSQDSGSSDNQDNQGSYDIYISLTGHHDLVYLLHAIA